MGANRWEIDRGGVMVERLESGTDGGEEMVKGCKMEPMSKKNWKEKGMAGVRNRGHVAKRLWWSWSMLVPCLRSSHAPLLGNDRTCSASLAPTLVVRGIKI